MKKAFATFVTMILVFAAIGQIAPNVQPIKIVPGEPTLPATTATPAIEQDSTHAPRILTFEFDYPFKLNWKHGKKRGQYQMEKINSDAWGTAPGNTVEIQTLTVSVKSTTDPATTYQQLKDGLILFFSTNGLIIQPGSDFADAIYWGASFAEIVLQKHNNPRLTADIVSIRGRDANNNHVIFNWEQLRHYPFPTETTKVQAAEASKQ